MEYYNILTIRFEDKDAAIKCKESVITCLDGIEAKPYGYSENYNFGDNFRMGITYDGDQSFVVEEEANCSFATPEDTLELLPEMARNIAENSRDTPFYISSFNTGTYTDSKAEVHYRDGKIELRTTYYPEGDYDTMLCCPECGEEIVSVSEYDSEKIYTCPECGEECDLEEEYEESRPIEKTVVINL